MRKMMLIYVHSLFVVLVNVIVTIAATAPTNYAYASKETIEQNLPIALPHILESEGLEPHNLSTSEYTYLYLVQPGEIEDKELFFVVSPCSGNISWSVDFRDTNAANSLALYKNAFDKKKFQYSGSKISVYHLTDAKSGLYSIRISAATDQSSAIIFVSGKTRYLPIFNSVRLENRRRIRVKKNFKSSSVKIEWPKFESIDPFFKYVIVINTKKSFNSLCEVYGYIESPDFDLSQTNYYGPEMIFETVGASDLSLQFNLTAEKTYYVDIFICTSTDVSVPYAHNKFEFKKFRTLQIRDGELKSGNMFMNGGKISYRYKVPMKKFKTAEQLQIYVIPSGQVVAEIKQNKKLMMRKKVSGFARFNIAEPNSNNTYVIKIIDESKGKDFDREIVEVYATVDPKNFLPEAPADTSLRVKIRNFCRSASPISNVEVSWQRVKSNHTLQYAISVIDKYADEPINIYKYKNTSESILLYLQPDQEYIIQVKVRKQGSKVFMPYQLHHIRTPSCADSRTSD